MDGFHRGKESTLSSPDGQRGKKMHSKGRRLITGKGEGMLREQKLSDIGGGGFCLVKRNGVRLSDSGGKEKGVGLLVCLCRGKKKKRRGGPSPHGGGNSRSLLHEEKEGFQRGGKTVGGRKRKRGLVGGGREDGKLLAHTGRGATFFLGEG